MIVTTKRKIVFWFVSLISISWNCFSQPIYSDIAVSHTSCVAPCASGVQNPSYASDGDLQTYALLNNSLGVGNNVEIVTGFSNTGAPGAMIVIPIKKSTSLINAGLLALVTVEVLDASNNIIVQKTGLNSLDVGVLNAADETSAITLFAPPSGTFEVSKIRVKLGGALSVQTSVYVGDAFYVEPSGAGCGIRYASTHDEGGSGICVGCSVSNPDRAVDGNFTNYAQITMVVGISATRYLELGFPSAGSNGDFVGIVMGSGSGLLDVSLLGNVTVTLYNGATAGPSYTGTSLLSASVLNGGSQQSMIGFNATSSFTSIRITMSAVAGLLNTMRVYGAVTYDPTPPVVTVSATPSATICDGTTAQISATNGFAGYTWSSGQSTQNITVGTAGSYAVVCTNGGGCPFFSPPVRVALIAKPAVPTVTADPLNCLGGNVRFSLGSSNAAYRYQVLRGGNFLEGDIKAGTGSVMNVYSVPVFSSDVYRIQTIDTSTGCTALSVADINITAPTSPSLLAHQSDYSKCWVKPGNRYVHFIQPGTTRILASINPKTNDLGEVEVYSYVNASPLDVQACGTYQSWYATSVLNRRWVVEPTIQPTTPVDMRMYFDLADFNALSSKANINTNPNDDIYTVSELVLSKYDGLNEDGDFSNNCGNGSTVRYEPTTSGIVSANLTSFYAAARYIDYTIPGFSEFWLHGNSTGNVSALPIELVDFSVDCIGETVQVNWTTATEINNAFFTISKSKDAISWETVEVLNGSGNSNQPIHYSIIDDRPNAGTSYYRLEQTDIDGTTEIFDPISVSCTFGKSSLTVYPNPTSDFVNVSIISPQKAENILVKCYDKNGKVHYIKQMDLYEGMNQLTIDCLTLPNGIYQLFVESASFESIKFLVIH